LLLNPRLVRVRDIEKHHRVRHEVLRDHQRLHLWRKHERLGR
jgi:hypothetical protein